MPSAFYVAVAAPFHGHRDRERSGCRPKTEKPSHLPVTGPPTSKLRRSRSLLGHDLLGVLLNLAELLVFFLLARQFEGGLGVFLTSGSSWWPSFSARSPLP